MTGHGAHEGRVAIVTGAASGIGRAVVDELAAGGAGVVAVDLSARPERDRVVALSGDVTDAATSERAVATALDRFGRLDAVALNAGIPASGDLLELPLAVFDRVIEVNVRAVLIGMRAAIPALRAGGAGRIVVTASTSGLAGDPRMWPYNTSKGAVVNLVKAAALDLAADGITVNAVCPGPTHTGMTEGIREVTAVHEGLRRAVPMQRWGEAHEIAAVISFLLSPSASFVTGVAIPVDGGITANTGQFLPRPIEQDG
jgi:meso-butanediol dehydrogenase / (S,S)-butanediol dehydrogenase / diacetyl reductase